MKVIYAVEIVEIEFGKRSEGYSLYSDLTNCLTSTVKSSESGTYKGGYYGPARPLEYIEVPYDSLKVENQIKLDQDGTAHTDNNWTPEFVGKTVKINVADVKKMSVYDEMFD